MEQKRGRGRPQKTNKKKEKTIKKIKKNIEDAEKDKVEIVEFAEELQEGKIKKNNDTGLYVILACGVISLFVLAFGMLERSRFVAMVGGIGFILCLLYIVNAKLWK